MGKLVNFPKAKTNADLLKFLGCDPVTGKGTQKMHMNLPTMVPWLEFLFCVAVAGDVMLTVLLALMHNHVCAGIPLDPMEADKYTECRF